MTDQAITTATLLRVRLAHEHNDRNKRKKKITPNHRPVKAFYQHLARDRHHPVTNITDCGALPIWTCIQATFHLNHKHARWWPHDVDLRIDIPPRLVDELIPADAPPPNYQLDQMTDRQIITEPGSWPSYPYLFLENPTTQGRGGELIGWLIHGDNPRGKRTIRVQRPHDQNIPYRDVNEMVAFGWQVRRRDP